MLLTKALVWRFFIAIPVGLIIGYIYLGELTESVELTILMNFVSTILYYLYDLVWYKYFPIETASVDKI